MPRKDRRLREAKREAEEAELDALLGCKPTFMSNQVTTGPGNIANLDCPPIYRGGLNQFDDEGYAYQHDNSVRGRETGNSQRNKDRKENALDLQKKYPNHWKRGGAKFIAMTETENGNKITDRAVTGYIKDFPKD